MTIINQNLKIFFLDNDSIIEEFLSQNKEEEKISTFKSDFIIFKFLQ